MTYRVNAALPAIPEAPKKGPPPKPLPMIPTVLAARGVPAVLFTAGMLFMERYGYGDDKGVILIVFFLAMAPALVFAFYADWRAQRYEAWEALQKSLPKG